MSTANGAHVITLGASPTANYETEEAMAVLVGYAFAPRPLAWTAPRGPRFGESPHTTTQCRWAYRVFDCVPPSQGPLDHHDLLVTTALNSRIRSKDVSAMLAVCKDVSAALDKIPSAETFWEPASDDSIIALKPSPAEKGSIAWYAWRAYWLLDGTPGVDVAVAHKTLHHKRPKIFPLLDRKTSRRYGGRSTVAWKGIYYDLASQAERFEELENEFNKLVPSVAGAVTLTRLRIHDILLWCDTTKQRQMAAVEGKTWLIQRSLTDSRRHAPRTSTDR